MLLGHPSDPMAKVSGDNSMAEKRGVGEHVRPPQDLRDMAGLLEPQTSEMEFTSLVTACWDGADRIGRRPEMSRLMLQIWVGCCSPEPVGSGC
jgi:hypothetical protein